MPIDIHIEVVLESPTVDLGAKTNRRRAEVQSCGLVSGEPTSSKG
jgi:hypothetical protein